LPRPLQLTINLAGLFVIYYALEPDYCDLSVSRTLLDNFFGEHPFLAHGEYSHYRYKRYKQYNVCQDRHSQDDSPEDLSADPPFRPFDRLRRYRSRWDHRLGLRLSRLFGLLLVRKTVVVLKIHNRAFLIVNDNVVEIIDSGRFVVNDASEP
ncbi:MAG: hypothetical protein ACYSP9_04700, partial [Planctomycetota bacterium]